MSDVNNEEIVTIPQAEYLEMRQQIADIHKFIAGIASALNSPMVKTMLPPNVRGMLGG